MNAVIIDDESASHEVLSELLYQHPKVNIIGSAYNVANGLSMIRDKQPEMLFLDVKMPDGTGFELLEHLDYKKFAVVFISAHNEYAKIAFDFEAMAYLEKPISSRKLFEAIDRAEHRLLIRDFSKQVSDFREIAQNLHKNRLPSRLAISNSSGMHYLPINSIVYLSVNEGCTEIFTNDGRRVSVSANLIEYERRFKPYDQFMRVHRSYMVNLHYVSTVLSEGEAKLTSGMSVPISGKAIDSLKDKMKEI